MTDYSNIIDHPHYQSKTRPHMSMSNRAAQFSAFAALSGYSERVNESQGIAAEDYALLFDLTAEEIDDI
ncbi:MAG: hypothetical protein K5870_11390 [Lachnospiraceae bacterium]|nr:hypothetical protein [Lachnospiraceae bacterium]